MSNIKYTENATLPEVLTQAIATDWSGFEQKLLEKIKKNLQSIAQFRENSANIGPLLKAKFDKKVADLEQKNMALELQIQECRIARDKNTMGFTTSLENSKWNLAGKQ